MVPHFGRLDGADCKGSVSEVVAGEARPVFAAPLTASYGSSSALR